jgi:asparagine synthase (glutamine-hydrolysing)
MYDEARASGVRVFLDGHGGDSNLSYGLEYLNELARTGRWWALWRASRWVGNRHEVPTRTIFRAFGLREIIPAWAWRLRRRGTPDPMDDAVLLHDRPISRDFARRTGVLDRLRAAAAPEPATRSAREMHRRVLADDAIHAIVFEWFDRIGQGFGLEARYPFFDRKLIDWCLSMPPRLKIHEGWTRYHIRAASEGVMPPEVQWRVKKSDLSPYFRRAMLTENERLILPLIEEARELIAPYVDVAWLRAQCRAFQQGQLHIETYRRQVWPAATLAAWLLQRRQVDVADMLATV